MARYFEGMFEPIDPLFLAEKFHKVLPDRIRRYLNGRGITDSIIDLHLLGWNGERITIPIFDRDRKLVFFKLAKDTDDANPGPKMRATPGAHAELYGWERVLVKPYRIIICEGEFDRLVLEGQGFAAVTSTGGAGVFRTEWAEAFTPIPEVYLCYDRDEAGQRGAKRVAEMIPHARLIELPEEVGDGGDITDFFVRLGRSREDFQRLTEAAQRVSELYAQKGESTLPVTPKRMEDHETNRLKSTVPIEAVVGRYVALRPSRKNFMGLCPFHEDHDPSLAVYPKTGTFHCFGCRAHGDIVHFLMKVEHLSFREAFKVLRELGQDHDRRDQKRS